VAYGSKCAETRVNTFIRSKARWRHQHT